MFKISLLALIFSFSAFPSDVDILNYIFSSKEVQHELVRADIKGQEINNGPTLNFCYII